MEETCRTVRISAYSKALSGLFFGQSKSFLQRSTLWLSKRGTATFRRHDCSGASFGTRRSEAPRRPIGTTLHGAPFLVLLLELLKRVKFSHPLDSQPLPARPTLPLDLRRPLTARVAAGDQPARQLTRFSCSAMGIILAQSSLHEYRTSGSRLASRSPGRSFEYSRSMDRSTHCRRDCTDCGVLLEERPCSYPIGGRFSSVLAFS
jgi:hypothetical protein